jgi:hypothetical protein
MNTTPVMRTPRRRYYPVLRRRLRKAAYPRCRHGRGAGAANAADIESGIRDLSPASATGLTGNSVGSEWSWAAAGSVQPFKDILESRTGETCFADLSPEWRLWPACQVCPRSKHGVTARATWQPVICSDSLATPLEREVVRLGDNIVRAADWIPVKSSTSIGITPGADASLRRNTKYYPQRPIAGQRRNAGITASQDPGAPHTRSVGSSWNPTNPDVM